MRMPSRMKFEYGLLNQVRIKTILESTKTLLISKFISSNLIINMVSNDILIFDLYILTTKSQNRPKSHRTLRLLQQFSSLET